MTPVQHIAFGFACLLIGLSKGGLGGPLPVSMVIPMLSLVMDPREAVPLTTPYLIFADWFALRAYWRKWDTEQVRLLLPMAIVGVIIGGLTLSIIPENALILVIAVATLIVIIYKLASDRFEALEYEPRTWHGYLAGWASGFTSTLANAGAFPFTIYMLLQKKLSSVAFIGTVTLFFAIINLLKIPIFIQQDLLSTDSLLSVIWALPIIPFGVWLGRKSLDYISQQTFQRVMMGLLILTVFLLFGNLL
ncbi:MAG: sulfite exporter TauE/SafE family protein [Anaerolineae bacterium]|nr:sulfite exporter TauE/SafE family protein [Anaerolineae bacterium]MDQ7034839.1 sulfite exporter TauE/SafE family protein [Anaerolineae bacterium]